MQSADYQNKVMNAAAEATSLFLSGKAGTASLPELLEANIMKAVGSPIVATGDDADQILEHSLQSRSSNLWSIDGGIMNSLFVRQRTPTDISPYGSLGRDIQLRKLLTLKGNDLIQGAVTTIVQKVQSTERIIEGPKRTASQYDRMFKQADLGLGYDQFLAKIIQDYLTTDNGMFIELIWSDADKGEVINDVPGKNAQLIGLAAMDANACMRTGDPVFPVLYQSLMGQTHRLHRSRVLYAADMPSANEKLLGRGFCAMSRALSMAEATVRFSNYRSELLDDIPPLGLLILSGINKAFWETNKKEFNGQRTAQEEFIFANLMTLFSMDPSKPASATLLPFKNLWDNFDEKQFWDGAIDLVALAFQLDRQELAPVNQASMGTGAQSSVLAQKARGKGIGNMLSALERMFNPLLPESCTFKFDFHDDEQDYQQAQLRNQKVGTIISLYTASSGNSKPSPTSRPKPLAGDTLKAEGDAPPTEAKPADAATPAQNAPDPNANPDMSGLGASFAPQNKETLISWDEARQILVHEIPEWADILEVTDSEDEAMYDDSQTEPVLDPEDSDEKDEKPTEAEQKQIEKHYGKVVRIYGKSGAIKEKLNSGKHKAPKHSFDTRSHLKLSSKEIDDARSYLAELGIVV